jgi:ribosomal protein S18 acetylase RimI-like enzyme
MDAAEPATTPTVRLRPMNDQEYDAYRERSVPDYANDLVRARGMSPEAALGDSDSTFPKNVTEAAAPARTWVLRVLTAEGESAGWLWLGPHPHREDGVYVYDIEIDEAHRGLGLGRATMLAAEDLARAAGLRHIALNVFGWNSRAESLYRSLGYETGWTQLGKPLQDQP